jgi:hypothetical protein
VRQQERVTRFLLRFDGCPNMSFYCLALFFILQWIYFSSLFLPPFLGAFFALSALSPPFLPFASSPSGS